MFKTPGQAVWWSWFWRNEARSVQPLGRIRLRDSVFWRWWRWCITYSHQRVLPTIGKFSIRFRSIKHPCSSLGLSIFTTLKVISVVTVQFVIMEPANFFSYVYSSGRRFLLRPSYFITNLKGCNNYWIITVLWLFSLNQKFTDNAKLQVLELLYIL